MTVYASNQDRTLEYLKKFDRKKTLQFLIKSNKPIIFDVGANMGSSLLEFKKYWPGSIVHCFEPQEECWSSLEKIQVDSQEGSVFINKEAAGNVVSKNKVFYTHDVSNGISGFNKVNMESKDSIELSKLSEDQDALHEYSKAFNHERMISTVRLDDYCHDRDIKKLDLLKIDTQGFEPEVLEGFGASLKNISVVLTELMFYDYYARNVSFSDIERHLLPAGFKIYDINHISKNPMNGRTDWVDVIYVNEQCIRDAK